MRQEDNNINNLALLRGVKIAEVVSNHDPKAQERVLVRVLGVHNVNNKNVDNGIWAHHCAPSRDEYGDLPEPGDYIYGMFADPANPLAFIWFGFVRSSFQTDLPATLFEEPGEIDSVTDHDEDLPKVTI